MKISRTDSPKYYRNRAPEIDNNPLLAHLQLPPETDKDAVKALALPLHVSEADRALPSSIRRIRVTQLARDFFVPSRPEHRRAMLGITTQLFSGYLNRNPLTAMGQRILLGGTSAGTSMISLVAGHSGMGKSTLIRRILDYLGNQVCQHQNFHDTPFPETQILWLRRNVPEHCTVGSLCAKFGDLTDQVLGAPLYTSLFERMRGQNRHLFLAEIRRIITAHHVGLLVLDEFQNLSLMGVGAKKIISLLINLRDELGLPIVIVGTYKALRLLQGDLSIARRLVEGGYYDLERPTTSDEAGWHQLCEIAWGLQWVRKPIVHYDHLIGEALYEVSQGINAIMINVLMTAQQAAMETGAERVDADSIIRTFNERMRPLHPAISILKSGNQRLMEQFDDMFQNLYPTSGTPSDLNLQKKLDNRQTTSEDPERVAASATKAQKRPATSTKVQPAKPTAILSEEQIRRITLADSSADLLKVLGTS
ncbi:ATP-binding protein [Achromobacter sp.]|uniref:AAA family ATPase n=1 Tax=Achromobacter sp. TaxID=134375 RepID=UPI00257C3AAD|nr:ATP-binding protein [Achromobacter sp.]